jgi:DNA mismatch repair protein MutS
VIKKFKTFFEKNNEYKVAQSRETLRSGGFFNLDDPLLEEIKEEILNLDINTLTPIEAMMKLNEIKRMLGKK